MLRKTVSVFALALLLPAAVPSAAEAQRHAVRRPAHRRVVYAPRAYYPVYYSPYSFYGGLHAGWYSGWYGGGWYGWPGWYPYGVYHQHYPPYPYGYYYNNAGAARIEVKPREAEVYVDGYLVGTVDDFDGWLQRLHMPPGEHEVQIYLPGHRTLRERVLFRPGATVRITGALEPLPAGSADEPRPAPAPGRTPSPRDEYRNAYPPPGRPGEQEQAPERGRAPEGEPAAEAFGTLTIRVQPRDAEVLVDGERWETPPAGERLVLQLPEGTHRVEIRRSGYRTYSTTVAVREGGTTPLNVSLARE